MENYPNLNEKQIEWLTRQFSTISGFVEMIGVTKLSDNDWEWIVDTAKSITDVISKKSTNRAVTWQAIAFINAMVADIDKRWRIATGKKYYGN